MCLAMGSEAMLSQENLVFSDNLRVFLVHSGGKSGVPKVYMASSIIVSIGGGSRGGGDQGHMQPPPFHHLEVGVVPPLPEPCLSIVYYGSESKLYAHECVVPPYTNLFFE